MSKPLYTPIRNLVLALAGLCAAPLALAQVSVGAPWIRATVPAQKTAGAFMQIKSVKAARLVGVSTPVAGRAELHQMSMDGQTMRMHAVDGVDLPANQPVDLAAGGYHIMLFDLQRQLKDGDQVPLTLRVVDAGGKPENVTVQVPVKPIGYVAR
ncbi:copper chaperone PCu(A)C [Massilia sp. 9096]|uniref:copper chaperone PCu(A)C n=1 Tax=Massilia sp. 9096 TaxID=1500894 RepID=UPI000565A029|nr:copper chaperone PCu(A)C [Massilia sp. 9096]